MSLNSLEEAETTYNEMELATNGHETQQNIT